MFLVLMRCLADNILVGLPQNINILHVAQLQVFDESTTVLEEVLAADKAAANTIKEGKCELNSSYSTRSH